MTMYCYKINSYTVIMTNSYSQLGQDVSVIDFFQSRRDGYFIEVGAYDGIYLSNTYMLEKQFNWNGICIEPLPTIFALLQQNRSCSCVNAAVYSEAGLELEFVEGGILSGITQCIDRHIDIINNDKIHIQTKTLTNIMDERQMPSYIEYLSIDTEGSELEVLRGIDWSRYSFGYIGIEHNYIEPRRAEMRQLLEKQGYTHFRENEWDDDYVRNK